MKQRIAIFTLTAAASFLFGTRLHGQERYDHKVRELYFAGFSGNAEALEKAMKATDATLKENPKHAEAMVWHGSGVYFLAGQAFQKGDVQKGMEMAQKGIAMMDEAVALAPDSIGVRAPRGAVLISATRFQQGPHVKPLLERAAADYAHMYKLQEAILDKLGTHPRGELLMGLADATARMGDKEKAKSLYERVAADLPGTPYERYAKEWLEKGSLPPQKAGCIGCHTGK